MNSLQKQRGMGLWSALVLILVCVFLGKFAFTIAPMYTENRYIIAGLKELSQSAVKPLEKMTDGEIKRKMQDFYMINNVTSEESKKIAIVRNTDGVIVKIDYDTRAHFFYNIDLVLSFANHLHSAQPERCCNPIAEPPRAKY